MVSPARHCWIFTLGLAASSPALAGHNEVVVDGIEVHLGLMAAERLRGYPRDSVEAAMHGGESYGQYFRLIGRAPPSIVVRIARPGASHVTEAKFRSQPD